MRHRRSLLAAGLAAAFCAAIPAARSADQGDAWFSRSDVPERGLALTNRAPLVGRPVQDSTGAGFAKVSYVLFEPNSGTVRYLLAASPEFYGNLLLPLSEVKIEADAVRTKEPASQLLQQRHYGVEELERHYPPMNMREREFNLPPSMKTP